MSSQQQLFDPTQITGPMMTMYMMQFMLQSMNQMFGGGGLGGIGNILKDILPILILVKVIEKLG